MEKIFLSNDLHFLLHSLKKKLFEDSSFSLKRVIVVPSFHLKEWLMQKLAQHEGIAFLDFVEEKNIGSYLFDLYGLEKKLPTYLELHLAINQKLQYMLENQQKYNVDFSSLLCFLQIEKGDFGTKSRKRIASLSEQLTSLFFLYALYRKETKTSQDTWQELLWQEVFKDFAIPCLDLLKPFMRKTNKGLKQIHFFNLSFLPPIYRHALEKMPYKIFHYVLSPCLVFWEDACSYKEIKYLKKKSQKAKKNFEEVEKYWQDTNWFLANLGKIKKEYLKFLDNEKAELFELYNHQEEKWLESNQWKETSLLKAIKNDFLYLRNIEDSPPYQIKEERDSIKIQIASSKIRELEILSDYLIKKLEEDPQLRFSDIRIYAPDIKEYASYLHFVFGNEENDLPYKILDLGNGYNHSGIQGFLHFLELINGRWDKKSVFDLLENSSFMQKQEFCSADILKFKKWVKAANINWSIDLEHRQELLQKKIKEPELKTWTDGFERLLFNFVFDTEEESEDYALIKSFIDLSDWELFNKILTLFSEIKKDLQELKSNSKRKLKQWALCFKELFEKYFLVNNSEKVLGFDKFIEKLCLAEDLFKEEEFDFSLIYQNLIKALEKDNFSFNSSCLNALTFASLKQEILPSKIICLIGMGEDFPKREQKSSLNLLSEGKQSYYPLSSDLQKNLFLDVLLLCESSFYISYIDRCPVDGKKKFPSGLLQEFYTYIEQAYENINLKEDFICKHPPLSFDKTYFSKESSCLSSYSTIRYKGAQKYYLKEGNFHFFLQNLLEKPSFESSLEKLPEIIDIKKLSLLASNPLKFYLSEVHQIFLEKEEEKEELKDFSFSFLDKYLIRNQCHKKNIETVLNKWEKEGFMPVGMMKHLSQKEMKEQIAQYFQTLASLNINLEDFEKVELVSNIEKEKYQENKWLLPPIEVILDNQKIKIVGTLNHISSYGYMLYSDEKIESLLKFYPEILLYSKLSASFLEKDKKIILTKGAKIKTIEIEDVDQALLSYLNYYKVCLKSLSPLLRPWAKTLLTRDEAELFKTIQKTFTEKPIFEDFYFKWLFSNRFDLNLVKNISNNWSSYLQNCFQPLLKLGEKG